jgi:hypothetical protein
MRLIAIAVVAGVLVGTVGWASDQGPRVVQWSSAVAAVWLVGAFAAGALARGPLRSALVGAGTIVVGVGTYYVLFVFVSGLHGPREIVPVVIGWSTVGVAIGAAAGWAGDAWRRGKPIGVALLAGALAGEAMLLLSQWHNRSARYVLAGELALGAVLPYLLARPKLARAVALTCAVAVAVAVTEDGVRDAMRAAGWAGA